VIEDLKDQRSVFRGNLDRDPLTDQYRDATSKNIITRSLLLHFCCECRGKEFIKVELFVDDGGRETDRGVDRVFEEYVLILGRLIVISLALKLGYNCTYLLH